jgi:hypothetical protein
MTYRDNSLYLSEMRDSGRAGGPQALSAERTTYSVSCPVCNYPHDFDNAQRADRVIARWHTILAAEGAREVVARLADAICRRHSKPNSQHYSVRGPCRSARIEAAELGALLDEEAAR